MDTPSDEPITYSNKTGDVIDRIVDLMCNMDPAEFPGSLDTQKVGWGDEDDPLPALASEDYLVPKPESLPEVYDPAKWVPPEPRKDTSTPLTIFNEIIQKLEGRIKVTWTDESRSGLFFSTVTLSMGPYRGSYCTSNGWKQKKLAMQNTALFFLRNPAPWVVSFVQDGKIPEGCDDVFSPEYEEKLKAERQLNAPAATLLSQKKKRKADVDLDKLVTTFEIPEFSVESFTKAVEASENLIDIFDDSKLVVYGLTQGNSFWPITATIVTIDFAIRRWSDNKLIDCDKNCHLLLDYGGKADMFNPVVSNMQVESEVLVRASNEYVAKGLEHTQLASSDALLVYIKLVAVQPYKMSKEEKQYILNLPPLDRFTNASEAKRRGDKFMKRGLYKLALDQYINALRLLTKDHMSIPKTPEWAALTALINWKCSFGYLHLGNLVEAEKSVNESLLTEPKNYKYLLTRALIEVENHDYLEALVDLRAVTNNPVQKKEKYVKMIEDLTRDLEPHKALLDQVPEKPAPIAIKATVTAGPDVTPAPTVPAKLVLSSTLEAPKEDSTAEVKAVEQKNETVTTAPVPTAPVPTDDEGKLRVFLQPDRPIPPAPTEQAQLEVYNLIKNFILSDNATLEFQAGTDKTVRALVHQYASDFGITSNSTGPPSARKTVVTKVPKKRAGNAGQQPAAPAATNQTGGVQHVQVAAIETATAATAPVKVTTTQQSTTTPAQSYQTWLDIPIEQRSNTRLIWTRPAKSDLPIKRVVIESDSESEEGDGYEFDGFAYMGNLSTLMNIKPKEEGEDGPDSEEDQEGDPNEDGYESDPIEGSAEVDKK